MRRHPISRARKGAAEAKRERIIKLLVGTERELKARDRQRRAMKFAVLQYEHGKLSREELEKRLGMDYVKALKKLYDDLFSRWHIVLTILRMRGLFSGDDLAYILGARQ